MATAYTESAWSHSTQHTHEHVRLQHQELRFLLLFLASSAYLVCSGDKMTQRPNLAAK